MNLLVETCIYELQLKREFGTAQLRRRSQRSVLVRITDMDSGHHGFGECIEHPTYRTRCESLQHSIDKIAGWLRNADATDLPSISACLEEEGKDFSIFARSAVDQALWDLHGRKSNMPTAQCIMEYFHIPLRDTTRSSITIGLDTPDMMAEDIGNYISWPILKIKLGGADDLSCLSRVRQLSDRKILRVDANEGWDTHNFLEILRLCEKSGVELIEQPFHRYDVEATRLMRHSTILSVIADESCRKFEDVEDCAGIFDGVNIKLYKCGGIFNAARMILKARELKMKVMLGCMVESVIGVSAMAQLSAFADFLDLDGACLIGNNPTSGLELRSGSLIPFEGPGNGFDQTPLHRLFE